MVEFSDLWKVLYFKYMPKIFLFDSFLLGIQFDFCTCLQNIFL